MGTNKNKTFSSPSVANASDKSNSVVPLKVTQSAYISGPKPLLRTFPEELQLCFVTVERRQWPRTRANISNALPH